MLPMERQEYLRMRAAEERHWWYRALHRYLLRFLPPGHSGAALDIGCGTGGWLQKLAGRGYHPHGLDVSPLAVELCRQRGFEDVLLASANQLPYAAGSFDLVTSIDVLEVEPVEPEQAVAAALAALKPGGYGLFVMAAHQWLLSEHDRAVGSVRRYDLARFKALLQRPGIEILRASYLFFSVFPLLAVYKLFNRPRPNGQAAAHSDVQLPPAPLNALLHAVCVVESNCYPQLRMPIGSSVCALVQKVA